MDINYEYYKIFYYVAKYRSFTKAANALYANQPNVTRAIKNLESELGCTLFARSNRGVGLTPEGEKLFAHVKIAVEHIQSAEDALSLDKSLQSGVVSVGATENTLHYVLIPTLKEFKSAFPNVNVKVTNNNTYQAINALKNGLVDFAVVTAPEELPKSLKAVSIRTFREVAVCGPAFEELVDKKMTVKELASYPLITLGAESLTYRFYLQYFLKNGAVLSPSIEVATTDQILSMVKSGLGIGFVPEYFIRDDSTGQGLHILDVNAPVPERTISIIKRTDLPLSIAAKQFEKMILSDHNFQTSYIRTDA